MADMRTCIGSAKFGIEAHAAPIAEFPVQPSGRDGLGRMCRPHWSAYTRALRAAAGAGTAKAQGGAEPTLQSPAAARVATKRSARVAAATPEPIRARPARGRKTEDHLVVEAVEAVEETSIA